MDKDDKFGENPFRDLDAKAFPKMRKSHEGIVVKAKVRHKYYNHAGEAEVSDEDRDLFVRAMARLPERIGKAEHSGFLLSSLCALPSGEGKKLARKKRVKVKSEPEKAPESKKQEDGAEEFLWAMRNAEPLARGGRRIAKTPASVPMQMIKEPGMEDFMDGSMEFTLCHTDEYIAAHVADLDQLTINQLARGQYSPEAHLDLHGLNSVQAFETLRDFVRSCWFKGLRVALIVTGRGHNSPDGQAVLRQKIQSWLTQEPFKRVVLAFCTAQPHDGGAGAIYVLFRKYRKKGRIYWERMPADADLY